MQRPTLHVLRLLSLPFATLLQRRRLRGRVRVRATVRRWEALQRRRRLHRPGRMLAGKLRRSSEIVSGRSLPATRMQLVDGSVCAARRGPGRDGMHRQQRLHQPRHVSGRAVHRRKPQSVSGDRRLSLRRRLQSHFGRVQRPAQARQLSLRRRVSVHGRGPMHRRRLPW